MPERIDARPVLALVGGGLVLVGLFLAWYKDPASEWTMNAWTAFEALDLILAGAALGSVYIAWEQISGRSRLGDAWLLPLGLLALVVVVSQILHPPPAAVVPAALPNPIAGPEPELATGAWLALGGAGALTIAGIFSLAHLSLRLELDPSGRRTAPTRRRTAEDAS